LFNYGIRHRKGLPISSSIAESAVNQFVSHRMVNKQQMRWTNEGAYCMGQVRGAVLNGGFSPRRISALKIADLASRQMHRFSISRRAPANEQNRPCDLLHAVFYERADAVCSKACSCAADQF
jgi:hypothetical protein